MYYVLGLRIYTFSIQYKELLNDKKGCSWFKLFFAETTVKQTPFNSNIPMTSSFN